MNEIKIGALLAFWVLKLRPLTPIICSNEYDYINEIFAANLMLAPVEEYLRRKMNVSISQKIDFNTILYRLRNWDLSKEALMFLSESLAELKKDEPNLAYTID